VGGLSRSQLSHSGMIMALISSWIVRPRSLAIRSNTLKASGCTVCMNFLFRALGGAIPNIQAKIAGEVPS